MSLMPMDDMDGMGRMDSTMDGMRRSARRGWKPERSPFGRMTREDKIEKLMGEDGQADGQAADTGPDGVKRDGKTRRDLGIAPKRGRRGFGRTPETESRRLAALKARHDATSVVAEKLMTMAVPTRWETLGVVLRDARIQGTITEQKGIGMASPGASYNLTWTTPTDDPKSPHPWGFQGFAERPSHLLRLALDGVLRSLGWPDADARAMAAEWVPLE